MATLYRKIESVATEVKRIASRVSSPGYDASTQSSKLKQLARDLDDLARKVRRMEDQQ